MDGCHVFICWVLSLSSMLPPVHFAARAENLILLLQMGEETCFVMFLECSLTPQHIFQQSDQTPCLFPGTKALFLQVSRKSYLCSWEVEGCHLWSKTLHPFPLAHGRNSCSCFFPRSTFLLLFLSPHPPAFAAYLLMWLHLKQCSLGSNTQAHRLCWLCLGGKDQLGQVNPRINASGKGNSQSCLSSLAVILGIQISSCHSRFCKTWKRPGSPYEDG